MQAPQPIRHRHARALGLVLIIATAASAVAADWQQFRGPDRDGRSNEVGLAAGWPEGGLPVAWRVPLGGGFSAISVADNRLFTLFTQRGSEYLGAFESANGGELWRRRLDTAFKNSFGSGPRSTPTVDGSIVYALGAQGVLLAVDTESGETVWSRDLQEDFGARVPEWGVATSPLVEGELLLLDVGGRPGYSVVALDKSSGRIVWHAGSEIAGYSSPIVIDVGGRRQAVLMTGRSVRGFDVTDGSELWQVPWKTRYDVNAATPLWVPPDGIYVSSGYGVGAALLRLRAEGQRFEVDEVWRSRRMKNQFSSAVLAGETIYGFDNTILKAIRIADGEETWSARGFGHGSLFWVEDRLIVLGDRGRLALVEATPDRFLEISSMRLFRGKSWTVPTLSDGRLYARDENEMIALDLDGDAPRR